MKYSLIFVQLVVIASLCAAVHAATPYLKTENDFNQFVTSHPKAAVLVIDRNKMGPAEQFRKLKQDFSVATMIPEYQKTGASFAIAPYDILPSDVAQDMDMGDDPATMAFFAEGRLVTGDQGGDQDQPAASDDQYTDAQTESASQHLPMRLLMYMQNLLQQRNM